MADVIARDDRVLETVVPDSPAPAVGDQNVWNSRSGASRFLAAAVTCGCAAILFAYLVAGSVQIEAGTRSGVWYRTETIWSDFTAFLERQGASPAMVVAVTGIATLSVLGSCLLIGLAFALRNDDPDGD